MNQDIPIGNGKCTAEMCVGERYNSRLSLACFRFPSRGDDFPAVSASEGAYALDSQTEFRLPRF